MIRTTDARRGPGSLRIGRSISGWEHIVLDAPATRCRPGVVEDGPLAADKEGLIFFSVVCVHVC